MDDVIWSCPDCDGDLEPDWDGPGRWCPGCEQVVLYASFRDDDAKWERMLDDDF